jgi:hypothetical protein
MLKVLGMVLQQNTYVEEFLFVPTMNAETYFDLTLIPKLLRSKRPRWPVNYVVSHSSILNA